MPTARRAGQGGPDRSASFSVAASSCGVIHAVRPLYNEHVDGGLSPAPRSTFVYEVASWHAVAVKVMISSVRRGLEPERDALPGLIMALGHQPVRFEDFSAQPHPSREACLRAVHESDVYLLLLGPHYGHVFPETGQSATHDEFVAAQAEASRGLC